MDKFLPKNGSVRRSGPNEYEMSVSIPTDSDGRLGHECPDKACSPGYFKVTPGTGITGNQDVAYCPYCRKTGSPSDFDTEDQVRYAKEVVFGQFEEAVGRMMDDSLDLDSRGKKRIEGGFVSIEISREGPAPRFVPRPFGEEVRRDVVCPKCGLDQSVYGLAVWCADCGNDIFLTHVAAELAVVSSMLSDVERRRTELGSRVATKDLENALEDVVSIFEAALRAMARRRLLQIDTEQVEPFFRRIGNAFQNVRRAAEIFTDTFTCSFLSTLDDGTNALIVTFEKRHPITHNLGVVDRKYLERAMTAEKEGRDIQVSATEIENAIETCQAIFRQIHATLFGDQA